MNGAHLAVLSAFAFAQPLLDVLGRNAAFFAVRGSSSSEIVLFALAITLVPPAVLLGLELVANLAGRTVRRILHVVFVGGLSAVIVLHVLTKTESLSGKAALAVAALAGAATAVGYQRAPPLRTFLTFLAPAPFVFLALFLLDSPVSKLVFIHTPEVKAATVSARTPVVLIVFDEFATASLMNRSGKVDPVRFPHFAALARNSTWFRSATTVHPHTEQAVPAILDGKLPKPSRLPIFADHPQNLFTLLGGSYQLKVMEALTHLCPPNLCKKTKSERFDPNENAETGSLASDAGIVYLHLLLPDPYAAELPAISNTWGNFAGHETTDEESQSSRGKPTKIVPACARNICRFASHIEADRQPTLYYVHSLLPHSPWLYLPSGKRYSGEVRVMPGRKQGKWSHDEWLALQGYQRYLLQLGYTDEALGIVLRRLRATGVYDRALVIVTADHGVSFRPGQSGRNVTAGNLEDIAFMPLFVKLPGQKRGRLDDSYARTIDILPTIAHVLGVRIPWRIDGRPLVGRRLPANGTVSVLQPSGHPVETDLRNLLDRRSRALAQQIAVFGTGSIDRVYRIGPHQELLGRSVAQLSIRPRTRTRVELDGRALLSIVDLSTDVLPSYVTGTVKGDPLTHQDLAVAVNGRIKAVTRTYRELGQTRFATLVPETALRGGVNSVTVLAIREKDTGIVLEELRGRDLTFTLPEGAASFIRSSDGAKFRVSPGALTGEVRALRRGDGWTFGGWAARLEAHRPAQSVVVFVDGRSAYVGRPGTARSDIEKRYGIEKTGFIYQLPGSLVPGPGEGHRVRVFALDAGVASELRYLPGRLWGGP